ncbi:hypothetical protein Tco_0600222 [Tanacetum coccineum]|uniref:Uncharacterized protein n=1 Tax=Tanacetum coccineum TaxID=301880 RepID=A0ABQ4WB50_9ASTR
MRSDGVHSRSNSDYQSWLMEWRGNDVVIRTMQIFRRRCRVWLTGRVVGEEKRVTQQGDFRYVDVVRVAQVERRYEVTRSAEVQDLQMGRIDWLVSVNIVHIIQCIVRDSCETQDFDSGVVWGWIFILYFGSVFIGVSLVGDELLLDVVHIRDGVSVGSGGSVGLRRADTRRLLDYNGRRALGVVIRKFVVCGLLTFSSGARQVGRYGRAECYLRSTVVHSGGERDISRWIYMGVEFKGGDWQGRGLGYGSGVGMVVGCKGEIGSGLGLEEGG